MEVRHNRDAHHSAPVRSGATKSPMFQNLAMTPAAGTGFVPVFRLSRTYTWPRAALCRRQENFSPKHLGFAQAGSRSSAERILGAEPLHFTQHLGTSSIQPQAPSFQNPWPPWRLIAIFGKLKIESTYCKKRLSRFSNRNKNSLSENFHLSPLPRLCRQSPPRLYPSDRGARMFHSIIERSAIPGGAIQ